MGHSTNPFYILCDLLNLYGLRWIFDDIILELKDRVANLKYPYKYQEQDRGKDQYQQQGHNIAHLILL